MHSEKKNLMDDIRGRIIHLQSRVILHKEKSNLLCAYFIDCYDLFSLLYGAKVSINMHNTSSSKLTKYRSISLRTL